MAASPLGLAVLSVLPLLALAGPARGNAGAAAPPATPPPAAPAATPAPAPFDAAPAPSPPAPAAPTPADPREARREALFDIGFAALVAGRLELAEQSFNEAAALPGDPVRASVAASFADRARRLREQRASERAAGPPQPTPAPAPGGTGAPPPEAPPRAPPPAQADDAATAGSDAARTLVPVIATVMGLGVYGWALPSMLDVDTDTSARTFIGLYMLTAGASFVTAYAATRTSEVTPAQANLAFYGATRGLWHGVLLSAALFGNTGPDRRFQLWAGSLLVGSVAEMTGGYLLAGAKRMTAGEARTTAVWGDFGLGWGLSMGAVLGLHHDDRSEDAQASGMGAMGIVGSAAGLAGGYFLSRRGTNTWGDGEVLRAAGLLGTWMGVTANVLLDWNPDDHTDDKKFFLSLVAGGAIGLWAGDRLVRRTNFTVAHALLLDLSTIAGALGVAGIAYLASTDASDATLKGITVASLIGGTLGFGLAYSAFSDDDADRVPASRAASGAGPTLAVLPTLGRDGGRGLALAGSF